MLNALARLEAVLERSGAPGRIEMLLPEGGRPRQLGVHALLLGMALCQADGRPAHLSRVHAALIGLDQTNRRRLGIEVDWKGGPHLLTYRQVERTFHLVVDALSKEVPDGEPSDDLCRVIDALLEASVPTWVSKATRALAVDWSDHETFSTPPPQKGGACADPEASWGRRKSSQPGAKDELFFGYELSAATMVKEEDGPAVPELVRRMLLTSCHVDPPHAFVSVLERMAEGGIALGDVLADSGYAHRVPEHWALPLRALGASIVTDHHPADRGPRGTFGGAVISNGNLYCPSTPPALLALGPLARGASKEEIAAHDAKSAELARYKLGRISRDDADGYHRVLCPAGAGKVRCPVHELSMALSHLRPEVTPPEHLPRCCTQASMTVPVEVLAKTAQKHDYPSKAHRISYARRTAVERTFSTAKDRASNDMTTGWCRLMGTTAISLFAATLFVVRNERILDAFAERRADDQRRLSAGLSPKTRRRRRKTLSDLVGSPTGGSPVTAGTPHSP
jgi:hypothetical protein